MNTPAETALAAAEFTAVDLPPPRDMLATAPLGQLRVFASLATKLMPAMTPELVPFTQSVTLKLEEESRRGVTYGTAGVKDLDGVQLSLLGDTVRLGTNGYGDVRAVTVAVSVRSVTGVVGQEGCTCRESESYCFLDLHCMTYGPQTLSERCIFRCR